MDQSANSWALEVVISLDTQERIQPESRKLLPRLIKHRTLYRTRGAAERRAAIYKAERGDSVATYIHELRPQTTPYQIKLSENWPVQRRPGKR
jgi:hypothetical protein